MKVTYFKFELWPKLTLVHWYFFFTDSKGPHPGFSESVKIVGAQMKTSTKLTFEIVWSKMLLREKTKNFDISLWFKKINFKHALQMLFKLHFLLLIIVVGFCCITNSSFAVIILFIAALRSQITLFSLTNAYVFFLFKK